MATDAIPSWLMSASDSNYLDSALSTLRQRENTREIVRTATRCSNTHLAQGKSQRARTWLSSLFSGSSHGSEQEYCDYYSVAVGSCPENLPRNRYLQVEPYDRTRVRVETNADYLNACWVQELHGKKWWIASQAPLRNTAHVFLSLILQQSMSPPPLLEQDRTCFTDPSARIRTVVQLTRDVENGIRKAHAYFPSNIDESWIILPEDGIAAFSLKVTLVDRVQVPSASCTQSTVSIKSVGEDGTEVGHTVTFTHMLYTAWPDHDVPEAGDRESLLNFVQMVDKTNRQIPADNMHPNPPVIVNCSAGIGRTGAFIALSSLLRKYRFLSSTSVSTSLRTDSASPLGPLPQSLSNDLIAQEIDSLRDQRPGMVQRDEQTVFVYNALASMFS